MKSSFSIWLLSSLITISTINFGCTSEGLNLFQILYRICDISDTTLSTLDTFVDNTQISLSTIEKILEELNFENNAIPHIFSVNDTISNALVQS